MLNSKKKNIVIIITKSYFSDCLIKKIKKSKLKNDYNFIFYYSLQKFTLKRFIINIAILNLFDFIEIIFNYIKKIFIKIRYTDNIREIKNINDIFFIKKLLSLKPSIVVSLLCCQIFKKNFLDNINCPIVNFHPGLLPNYRGLYPNFFSIINKEKKIGFTCHLIDKKIDHGKILSRIKYKFNYKVDNIFYLYKILFFKKKTINFICNSIIKLDKKKFKKRKKLITSKSKYYSYPSIRQILSYKLNLFKY